MKQQTTYFSWDFSNRWAIDEGVNDGYPFLRDLPTPLKLVPTPTYSTGLPYACSRQQASNTGAINWNGGAPAYVTTCPAQTDGWNWTVTNDVAFDFNTGLYWTSRRLSSANYTTAVSHCDGLTFGGRSDWRLPTLDEIRQSRKNGMYLWNSDFATSGGAWFRASNEILGDSTRAYTFYSTTGGVSNHLKTSTTSVRCVARDY